MPPTPSSPPARILIVEDELAMRTVLADILAAEGHKVVVAENGETGLQQARRQKPDLILLDVMMPKMDGLTLVETLRRGGMDLPVLMLTAKGMTSDRVAGLDAGADDYLVKPFSTSELLARVRALLRRVARRKSAGATTLELGEVRVDLVRLEARRGNRAIALTAKDYGILRLLMEAEGAPVTREQFLDEVWGVNAFPTTRTVDMHLANLRMKLEPDPTHPRYLKTVHGVGYRLELEAGQKVGRTSR
jgi:DNA-binding response OmpR family regulator